MSLGLGDVLGREVLVVDASALGAGLPNPSTSVLVMTHAVMEEALRGGHWEVEALVSAGIVKVMDAPQGALRSAAEAAREVGDAPVLSDADMGLLALALHLKGEGYRVRVVTNDIAVQNVASALGIGASGTFTGPRRRLSWIYYCPACGLSFEFEKPPPDMVCPRCGSRIRRKARAGSAGKIHK